MKRTILPPTTVLNQLWGGHVPMPASGVGAVPIVRVQLPPQDARLWTVSLAPPRDPAHVDAIGMNDVRGIKARIRYGGIVQQEREIDWPWTGTTLEIFGSVVQVDAVWTGPIVGAPQELAAEVYEGARGGLSDHMHLWTDPDPVTVPLAASSLGSREPVVPNGAIGWRPIFTGATAQATLANGNNAIHIAYRQGVGQLLIAQALNVWTGELAWHTIEQQWLSSAARTVVFQRSTAAAVNDFTWNMQWMISF